MTIQLIDQHCIDEDVTFTGNKKKWRLLGADPRPDLCCLLEEGQAVVKVEEEVCPNKLVSTALNKVCFLGVIF